MPRGVRCSSTCRASSEVPFLLGPGGAGGVGRPDEEGKVGVGEAVVDPIVGDARARRAPSSAS
jgi:hypothetical protein